MDSSSSADTPAQGGKGIEFIPGLPPLESAADLIVLAASLPPPDWILEGMIEAGDKALLIAPSKTGKTMAGLTIAEDLAAGRDFWGFHVERPRRVLYVNLEVKRDWIMRRLRGASAVLGVEPDAAETLTLWNMRGRGGEVRDIIEANPAAFAAFDLVILDPFYKLARAGEDENSSRDVEGR